MERIHKKSALAEASPLLLAAHDLGAELVWERYEQQLPLCAFTSNGLNCRKCFQGPCRINPFGDEPSRGVCGADRDQVVMESLFQATLDGVLESARALALLGPAADREFPDLASDLPAEVRERLVAAGLLPVRKADLLGVQNGFFSHKGYLGQTLRDLTRMGLIHLAFLSQAAFALDGGDGAAPDPHGLNFLMVGQAPAALLQALEQSGRKPGGKSVNIFAHGGHRLASVRAAADHGSPEFLLGMKVDALLVAPDAGWPGLETLAAKYGIPVMLVGAGKPLDQTVAEAVELASHHAQNAFYGTATRPIQAAPGRSGAALPQGPVLTQAFRAGRIQGVAVLFGEPAVKQTFFERTLALMEAALAEKALILLGGDLATEAEALQAELGKRQGSQLAAFVKSLEVDGLRPITAFGSAIELPRVVSLLSALAQQRNQVPVVAAFPEFYRASTWASAVSLLSLGLTVQIGIRLPFWGSPWLAQILPTEWQKLTGGTLLAAPTLPEARTQAEEMAACLQAGRAR